MPTAEKPIEKKYMIEGGGFPTNRTLEWWGRGLPFRDKTCSATRVEKPPEKLRGRTKTSLRQSRSLRKRKFSGEKKGEPPIGGKGAKRRRGCVGGGGGGAGGAKLQGGNKEVWLLSVRH